MRQRRAGAVLAAITLVFAGCTRESADGPEAGSTGPRRTNPPVVVTAASLERFDACPDLLSYLRTEGKKRVGPYGLGGSGYVTRAGGQVAGVADSAAAAQEGAAAPQAADDAAAKSFSGTNVQEANVDEPDSIKTDGTTIFTTRSNPNDGRLRLTSIAADPELGEVAGALQLPEGSGSDLLLDGDRLLVMGGGYMTFAGGGPAVDMASPIGGGGDGRAIIDVVDVSDPTNMRITDVIRLEGAYASARMVDGVVRLVLNSTTTERLDFVQPQTSEVTELRSALARNQRVAQTATIEQLLPRFKVEDAAGKKKSEGPLATCSSTYRPKTFSGFQTTSVVTIDPRDPDPRNSAAVVGGAGIVYASTENLYVATQNYGDPVPLTFEENGDARADKAVQPDPAKTSLHRFDIRDASKAVYAASGEVDGTVLNQWSLSEHDGHLRVATTEDNFIEDGSNRSSNSVTVFDARAGKLTQVGRIGDLGVNERIYGVRFIGSLGYVVTFRQVDPLHVIDLSRPSEPKLLGELKIPGYSAYLHPVGDDRLLGIGQDADEKTGGTKGTQLSLFDVGDPANPKRIDTVRIDNGSSPIEHDHHAFTWWGPKNLAIVPVSTYSGGGVVAPDGRETAPEEFKEAHVAIGYRVSGDQIREVGRANHERHLDQAGTGQIQRSIVIGDEIYTLSMGGMMSSDLDSFDERGWVSLS